MRIKAGQMGVGMNDKIGISKWEFSNGHSTGWLFLSTLVKCCFCEARKTGGKPSEQRREPTMINSTHM